MLQIQLGTATDHLVQSRIKLVVDPSYNFWSLRFTLRLLQITINFYIIVLFLALTNLIWCLIHNFCWWNGYMCRVNANTLENNRKSTWLTCSAGESAKSMTKVRLMKTTGDLIRKHQTSFSQTARVSYIPGVSWIHECEQWKHQCRF